MKIAPSAKWRQIRDYIGVVVRTDRFRSKITLERLVDGYTVYIRIIDKPCMRRDHQMSRSVGGVIELTDDLIREEFRIVLEDNSVWVSYNDIARVHPYLAVKIRFGWF